MASTDSGRLTVAELAFCLLRLAERADLLAVPSALVTVLDDPTSAAVAAAAECWAGGGTLV